MGNASREFSTPGIGINSLLLHNNHPKPQQLKTTTDTDHLTDHSCLRVRNSGQLGRWFRIGVSWGPLSPEGPAGAGDLFPRPLAGCLHPIHTGLRPGTASHDRAAGLPAPQLPETRQRETQHLLDGPWGHMGPFCHIPAVGSQSPSSATLKAGGRAPPFEGGHPRIGRAYLTSSRLLLEEADLEEGRQGNSLPRCMLEPDGS